MRDGTARREQTGSHGETVGQTGGHVGRTLLTRSRCPEARPERAADRELVTQTVARSDLTDGLVAEVGVVFVAHGALEEQIFRHVSGEVHVDSGGITLVVAGEEVRIVARETIRTHAHHGEDGIVTVGAVEAGPVGNNRGACSGCRAVGVTEAEGVGTGEGACPVRIDIRARGDLIGFFHVRNPEGQGHGAEETHVEVLGEISLVLGLFIRQRARAEGRRRIRAHGRVDGVEEGVVDFVAPVTEADVIGQATGGFATKTGGEGVILDLTHETGGEATGELLEGAVHGAILKTKILDGAVARIPVEEAAVALALGVVTVGVELHAVVEIVTRVVEQGRPIAVRDAPGLHHGAFDGGVPNTAGEACGKGSRTFSASGRRTTEHPVVVPSIGVIELAVGIVTPPAFAVLDGALREFLVEPVTGDGDEAAVAKGQTDVALDAILCPVAFEILTGVIDEADALAVFFQVEVDHPGDGVGTVLRGRAVPQHFDAGDRRRRNGCEVRALGTGTANLH